MNRNEFISKSLIGTFGMVCFNGYSNNLITKDPEDIGIQVPGENALIKDVSRTFKKKDEALRYYENTKQALKQIIERKVIYERIEDQFKGQVQKNGLSNSMKRGYEDYINGEHILNPKIHEYLIDKEINVVTPVINFKSSYDKFDITEANLCDKFKKQITNANSIIVMPTDNRPDKTIYEVDQDFAYLLINPKYYCIGLPSSDCVKATIDADFKKKINNKTGRDTTINSYKYQTFAYYGSSLCGGKGLANGPITRTIYHFTPDEAFSEYFNLVDIEACGDPKNYTCNLKI